MTENIMEYSPKLGKKVKRKSFRDCKVLASIFSVIGLAKFNKVEKCMTFKDREKAVELLNIFDTADCRSNFCSECQYAIKSNRLYYKKGFWYLD